MKLKTFKLSLVTSIATILLFPTYAIGNNDKLDILSELKPHQIRQLTEDEIKVTRGEYFSSYAAAFKFCATSYPGCSGKIERTKWGKWRVKSRLTGRYLKY